MERLSSTHVVIQTTRSTSIQSFCTKPLIRCHHHHVPPNPFTLLDTPLLREPTRLPPLALILYSDRTVRYGPQQVGRAGKTTPREEGVKWSLDVTACSLHFHIKIRVNGWLAKAMINSGVTGNFMSESFARKNKVPVQSKKDLYQLTVVDRTPLSKDKG